MKSLHTTIFILGALLSSAGIRPTSRLPADESARLCSSSSRHSETTLPRSSASRQRKQQLKADPKKVQAYNELAIAFLDGPARPPIPNT